MLQLACFLAVVIPKNVKALYMFLVNFTVQIRVDMCRISLHFMKYMEHMVKILWTDKSYTNRGVTFEGVVRRQCTHVASLQHQPLN